MTIGFYATTSSFSAVSTQGQVSTTGNGDQSIRRDQIRLKILYDEILKELEPSMDYYNNGQFQAFNDSYPDTINIMVTNNDDETFYYDSPVKLDKQDIDDELVYKYRTITNRVINNLDQGIRVYQHSEVLQQENDYLKTYKELIDDAANGGSSLQEYFDKIAYQQKDIFETSAVNNVEPIVKPWYLKYIQTYGPPGDGTFDAELLSNIILEMRENGEIDDDTIIS
jgi:hypothetical protein